MFFTDIVETNRCLDLNKSRKNVKVNFTIPGRIKKYKEVISDWDLDMSLQYLMSILRKTKDKIKQIKRVKRRVLNAVNRNIVYSHLILFFIKSKIYYGLL